MATSTHSIIRPANWYIAIATAVFACALGFQATSAKAAEAALCDGSEPAGAAGKSAGTSVTNHQGKSQLTSLVEPVASTGGKTQTSATLERISRPNDRKTTTPR